MNDVPTTEVLVYRAGAIGVNHVPVLRILAVTEVPDQSTLEGSRTLYQRDAQQLAEALFQHLPGGTIDQLLVELMQRRACLLRVRF